MPPLRNSGGVFGFVVGADDLGGLRAHTVRPYGGKRTGSVGSVWPGAAVEPHQGQILQTQGLEARKEPHPSTPDFARRKGYITSKG